MRNIFSDFETELKAMMQHFSNLNSNAAEIYAAYFKTTASSDIGNVLIGSGTAVTVASKLTKGTYQSGITFVADIIDFFNNAAVSTTDYQTTMWKIVHGESAAGSPLSEPVEEIGDKIKASMDLVLYLLNKCNFLVNLYFDEQVDSMVSSLSAQKILPGCMMTKNHLTSSVTLMQQFQKMLTNQAVTTGDYLATISLWLGEIQ